MTFHKDLGYVNVRGNLYGPITWCLVFTGDLYGPTATKFVKSFSSDSDARFPDSVACAIFIGRTPKGGVLYKGAF